MGTEWTLHKPTGAQTNGLSMYNMTTVGEVFTKPRKVLQMHGTVIAEMVGRGVTVCLCAYDDDNQPVHYHFLAANANQHYMYSVPFNHMICMNRSWGKSLDEAVSYHCQNGTQRMLAFDNHATDVLTGQFDVNAIYDIA